jgi:hypothetical protein
MEGLVIKMVSLDRFSQDITPVYPPEEFTPVGNPRLKKEIEKMNNALAAVKALENARSAVDELLNYINIAIEKGSMRVLVSSMRDLDQIPGEMEISECDRYDDSPFSHRAEKEFEGVKFYTFAYESELQCPLEHSV